MTATLTATQTPTAPAASPSGASDSPPGAAMLDALRADGPVADLGPGSDLYDFLIGSWEMEVRDPLDDGSVRAQSGECHFAWVLEGRAIQDLWIFPARRDRRPGEPPKPGNRYGTTLRVFDRSSGAWNVTWINPVTGAHNELVGRRVGDEIVQSGVDDEGNPTRWIFFDVTPTTFRWRAEVSADGGKTWRRDTEFSGRKIR